MPPSSSTPALQASGSLLASATAERPVGLWCALVAPHHTYDPHGSGEGILRQDSRPASVSGGLSGSTFEDPKAVLNLDTFRTSGRRLRAGSDADVTAVPAVTRREHRDCHDCRDSPS
jgi:hypothetical protein